MKVKLEVGKRYYVEYVTRKDIILLGEFIEEFQRDNNIDYRFKYHVLRDYHMLHVMNSNLIHEYGGLEVLIYEK